MEFYIAALLLVAGVALYVAAPLAGGLTARKRKNRAQIELERWEHAHGLAVQGLRELEFDREMRKLSDADYGALRAALEAQALEAMTEIERLRKSERTAARTPPPRLKSYPGAAAESAPPPAVSTGSPAGAAARLPMGEAGGARRLRFCPRCGRRTPAAAQFCADCGAALGAGERLATRA